VKPKPKPKTPIQTALLRAEMLGLSLGAVAAELGLDRSTLTHWKSGRTRRIAKAQLAALESFVLTREVRAAAEEE
jgi:transcriptional regulator with XRE-family HTH domain